MQCQQNEETALLFCADSCFTVGHKLTTEESSEPRVAEQWRIAACGLLCTLLAEGVADAVVIVTNASAEWVRQCAARCAPELSSLLLFSKLHLVSSRDFHDAGDNSGSSWKKKVEDLRPLRDFEASASE